MTDVVTKQQIWKDMFGNVLEKGAELAQTYDMPLSMSPSKSKQKPEGDKAVIPKTAGVSDAAFYVLRGFKPPPDPAKIHDEFEHEVANNLGVSVEEARKGLAAQDAEEAAGWPKSKKASVERVTDDDILKRAFELEDNEDGVSGEQPAALPQAKSLSPHVDVSAKEPPSESKEKKASRYACPSQGMYPLDGYDQVIKAASYFDEFGVRMEPEMRREYCHNLVKRASELGIKVSSVAARYGADTYASPEQIKIALDGRRALLEESDAAVLDKLAEAQPTMHPELFAETLHEFDRRNFLDQYYGDIPDPYFSTFDKTADDKVVTESDASPSDAIIIGNEYLPVEKLLEFSKRGYDVMWNRFGLDVAKAFSDDPKGIFDSMPRDQKLIIMRLANSNESQLRGSTTS